MSVQTLLFLFDTSNIAGQAADKKIETEHDKTINIACAPAKTSGWASAQSEQSSLCTQWVA